MASTSGESDALHEPGWRWYGSQMGGEARPWSLERLRAPRICALGRLRLSYEDREVPILGKPAHIVGALLIRREGAALAELLDIVWCEICTTRPHGQCPPPAR